MDFLFNALPMFQRVGGAAFHKNLDRTIALLDCIGNPQNQFKTIHVAGTNGKGSSCHMLSSVFQESGYKVGLYTSPHLKNFTERIRLNGMEVPEKFVVEFVHQNKKHLEDIKPSFFEMTVAMAFQYFAEVKVDIAVIEVGMGGRLDSTNVITPEVCLITNVSLDHQQYLGDTLDAIAKEKAGIMKPGIPAVLGDMDKTLLPVFLENSSAVGCKLHLSDYIICEGSNDDFNLRGASFWSEKNWSADLKGQYILKNIPGVIRVLELMREEWNINEDAVKNGIGKVVKNTGLKGRWQQLNHKPLVICDTGHNIDGVKIILQHIETITYNRLHMVWGTVADKDIASILQLLPKNAFYYFCEPSVPRKLEAKTLQSKAETFGITGSIYEDVNKALKSAMIRANKDDLIFVGGSTFVVADLEMI